MSVLAPLAIRLFGKMVKAGLVRKIKDLKNIIKKRNATIKKLRKQNSVLEDRCDSLLKFIEEQRADHNETRLERNFYYEQLIAKDFIPAPLDSDEDDEYLTDFSE